MTDQDDRFLRQAIDLARSAREHGNHPFGAVLVDPDGQAVLTAKNTVTTDRDVTGHAETNLVRLAFTTIEAGRLPGYTLYTSCEPCAMCSGAIYWAGIGRVVFALAESSLRAITAPYPDTPTLAHPCRLVFADGSRAVEVTGPLLEDEARDVHRDFWG